MTKDFDHSVLVATITKLHAAMTSAPYMKKGWIVLDNGGMSAEEVVEEILERMELSEDGAERGKASEYVSVVSEYGGIGGWYGGKVILPPYSRTSYRYGDREYGGEVAFPPYFASGYT